jgi:hypothetical protein
MGISIQVSGEALYTVGKQFRIAADSLKQVSSSQDSSASFKGDGEEWLAKFSVVTDAGEFVWDVRFSIDQSGGKFGDAEIKSPSSVKDVIDRMVFTVLNE